MFEAERVRWRTRSLQVSAEELTPARSAGILQELIQEAEEDFGDIPRSRRQVHAELDLRFLGQTHVLTLPLDLGSSALLRPSRGGGDHERIFRSRYRQRFGFCEPSWRVEAVALRVAVWSREKLNVKVRRRKSRIQTGPPPKPRSRRAMVIEEPRPQIVAVHDREALRPGQRLRGPVLVSEYSGTTLCPRGWDLEVDAWGNLVLERKHR
jgi:N-methylhydantoinase A/oxoprolinase/acetone carboxylase beta subunit